MKSLVIYTTMYGNTEKIARAIGGALSAEVLSVQEATPEKLQGIELSGGQLAHPGLQHAAGDENLAERAARKAA